MKKNIIFIIGFIICIGFVGCSKPNVSVNEEEEIKKEVYLDIATTDKNLYNIIKEIVKDKHYVEYIFKNREDLINYKIKEDTLENISNKDLFFYVGASFEPWIDEFLSKLDKSKVGVINVSRGSKLIPYEKEVKFENKILKDNPYYFLNLNNYKIVLSNTKNAIQDKDPSNRDFYEKNFSDILKRIKDYEEEFAKISDKTGEFIFIVDEDKLDYFIKYLNLNIVKIKRDDKDKITNEKEIEEICKKYKEKCVFLSSSSDILKNNEKLLDKYKIKTLLLKVYDNDILYEDMIKYNISLLKSTFK
ncbi:zinc ABC transporter substrate-binding protein [Clostridium sporogenes]|uniref:metal ABC transporter substrate-binding protein n=1 Tax=Clostridium sp. LCP25S3_F8 TaxID=3438751 RepID=UPI0013D71EB2|nr:zinc ABC transporter substrate-binding protein [Clostridium sporogenes]NFS25013.1 zinc ABC transporter substrate-binding protein [Clostridium sporogenes]